MIWAFKLRGCERCGRKPVEAGGDLAMADLHCHHRDPASKRRRAKRGIAGRGDDMDPHGRSRAALLVDLARCDVLCSEHHKAAHRNGAGDAEQMALFTGTGHAWEGA